MVMFVAVNVVYLLIEYIQICLYELTCGWGSIHISSPALVVVVHDADCGCTSMREESM